MKLISALASHPQCRIFRTDNSDDEDKANWEVEPMDSPVLLESEDLFIVKAKNILPDGTIKDCYMDISLPERTNDNVYFFDGKSLKVDYPHCFKGEFICAVPISCFGVYELFYSKLKPDIGIEILKEGLSLTDRKGFIAEDLGYILRDEGRFKEAAEMFQLAVDETPSSCFPSSCFPSSCFPSSCFIYGELAGCYSEIGETEKANKYQALFDKENRMG